MQPIHQCQDLTDHQTRSVDFFWEAVHHSPLLHGESRRPPVPELLLVRVEALCLRYRHWK